MFFYAKARVVQVRTVIAERRSEVSYDQKKTDVSTYVLPMRQLELLYIMLCGFRMQPVCELPIGLPGRPPGMCRIAYGDKLYERFSGHFLRDIETHELKYRRSYIAQTTTVFEL